MSACYEARCRETVAAHFNWYEVQDDPLSCQKISNLFAHHRLESIATPARVALCARLHLLDAWGNTSCTFGETERCYALLDTDDARTMCNKVGEFCFEAEDPLVDTTTLFFELSKLLWKSHCKAHRVVAHKDAIARKTEYYFPFVLQWRKEALCLSPHASPEHERAKLSKLSVLMPKSANTRLVTKKRDSVMGAKDVYSEKLAVPNDDHGYHARVSMSSEHDRQEFDKVSLHSTGSRNEKQKRHWLPFSGNVENEIRMEID